MVSRPLRSQTLRELFDTSRHLLQGLTAHLDQNLVHLVHDVERALRTGGKKSADRNIGDAAAHNVIYKALESQAFADEMSNNIGQALQLIREKAEAEVQSGRP